MAADKFDITKHSLVPKHTLVSEKEKKQLFEKYNISIKELPKILADDPAVKHLKPKQGDIIKVVRKSPTSGETVYYRGVINA
ncbi:DNA-directed RNA polymerase subunit H [Candidatus Woesearchaeota archaeon]|nr:DNA-directed RNA polymerase subunit H [Candidatus Woesearchaeota archaeon]